MAATELAIRLSIVGADRVGLALTRVRGQLTALGQAVPANLRSMGQLTEGLTAVGAAALAFGYTLSRLSGLSVAAGVEQLRIQLETLTGSAEKARELTRTLYELAAQTKFNTAEVAAFGASLLAAGVQAGELQGDLQALLDLLAAMGVHRSQMERVLMNIIQLRTMEAGRVPLIDIREMFRAMPGIGVALGRALGRAPLTMLEVQQLANQLGGREFYRLLIEAAQQFRGASRRLTILDALANLVEAVEFVLIPTGERFGGVLRAITPVLTTLLRGLRGLNEALFGIPGALFALAGAALAAANALRLLSKIGFAASFAPLLPLLRGLGAALGRFIIWLLGFLRSGGLRAGVLGLGIPLLAQLLGALLERLGLRGAGRALGVLGESAGIGATLGAIVGSLVPVIGTALGTTIGLIVGLLVGIIRLLTGGREERRAQTDAAHQTAQNTARMARHLEDIRVQLVGGGERARAAVTRYEVEAYLRQLAASGI